MQEKNGIGIKEKVFIYTRIFIYLCIYTYKYDEYDKSKFDLYDI
jgi:hypothetical protein